MKNKIIFLIFFLSLFNAPFGFSEKNINADKLPKNAQFIQEPIFNGKVYFYKSENQFKTTVILVHGVGDDASDIWANLVPVLEKRYRVICFDLPGFGRSDKGDALYSPKNYAAFIKWIYDKYINGPMYLIGHSMGGAISLCYAGIYPDNLQRLVLVDAAGILHRTAFTKSIAATKVTEVSKLNFFQAQVGLFSKFFETNLLGESQQFLPKDFSVIYNNSFLRKKLLDTPQKVAAFSLIYTDFSEQVNNIKAPLFIIWGENDNIAPLRTGKMLSHCIPISNLNIMPDLSHNPMIDRPSEFNNLIVKCLSDKLPETRPKKLPVAGSKSVTLNGNENEILILEGEYDTITLNNCRNILIKNATAKGLTINNSWIEIENLSVNTEKTAINAADSIVTITGGFLNADVGISLSNSKIDLAGVKITANKEAVISSSDVTSTIVLSICEIKSKYNNRFIHDIFEISKYFSL